MTKYYEWICDGCGKKVRYTEMVAPPGFEIPVDLDGWMVVSRLLAYGYADLASVGKKVTHFCSTCAEERGLPDVLA